MKHVVNFQMLNVLVYVVVLPLTAEILPASCLGDWDSVGVQGGIPDYPVAVNVKDFGAVGDGTTDDITAIQTAIDSCPSNSAVFLPAGTYLTTGKISIRRSIVLRGAGPRQSYLIHNYSGTGIQIGHEPAYPRQGEKITFNVRVKKFSKADYAKVWINGDETLITQSPQTIYFDTCKYTTGEYYTKLNVVATRMFSKL